MKPKIKRREYRFRLKNQTKTQKHMRGEYEPPIKRKERVLINDSENIETRPKSRNRKKRFR